MKTIAHILILCCLIGCGNDEKSKNDQPNSKDNALTEISIYSLEELYQSINLPKDFSLDTFQKVDTARNLSIFIARPVSGISGIDEVVFKEIDEQKNEFIISIDELIEEDKRILKAGNSDFQAAPISIFKDEKVTSYLFIVSYYRGGAVHPMTMYYSFNFDNKTNERIGFSEFFTVNTKADTTNLLNLITKAIGNEWVFISSLNDIDFNIEKDSLSFNFDDYEIASYSEGILRGRLHRKQLENFIKPAYR